MKYNYCVSLKNLFKIIYHFKIHRFRIYVTSFKWVLIGFSFGLLYPVYNLMASGSYYYIKNFHINT